MENYFTSFLSSLGIKIKNNKWQMAFLGFSLLVIGILELDKVANLGIILLSLVMGIVVPDIISKYRYKKRILELLKTLNIEEKDLLKNQLDKNERSFYTNYNDCEEGFGIVSGRDKYIKLLGIFEGLRGMGILVRSNSNQEHITFIISDAAWKLLQKHYKDIFN